MRSILLMSVRAVAFVGGLASIIPAASAMPISTMPVGSAALAAPDAGLQQVQYGYRPYGYGRGYGRGYYGRGYGRGYYGRGYGYRRGNVGAAVGAGIAGAAVGAAIGSSLAR